MHVVTHRDRLSSAAVRARAISAALVYPPPCWPWVWLYKSTPSSHTHAHHTQNVAPSTPHTLHFMAQPHMWSTSSHPPPSYPWLVRRAQVIAVFCSSSSTQGKMLVWLMAKPIRAFMTSSMNSSISWWVCWSPTRKTPGKGGGWGQTPPSPCIDGG